MLQADTLGNIDMEINDDVPQQSTITNVLIEEDIILQKQSFIDVNVESGRYKATKHNLKVEADDNQQKIVTKIRKRKAKLAGALVTYECYMCSLPIKYESNFRRHMVEKHGFESVHNVKNQCILCNKTFSSRNTLYAHRKQYHLLKSEKKRFLCHLCCMSFSSVSSTLY